MKLTKSQNQHLLALRVSDAVHRYSVIDRREWRWAPWITGPLIRSSSLYALESKKLARWMPGIDYAGLPDAGGRMIITNAGKQLLEAKP